MTRIAYRKTSSRLPSAFEENLALFMTRSDCLRLTVRPRLLKKLANNSEVQDRVRMPPHLPQAALHTLVQQFAEKYVSKKTRVELTTMRDFGNLPAQLASYGNMNNTSELSDNTFNVELHDVSSGAGIPFSVVANRRSDGHVISFKLLTPNGTNNPTEDRLSLTVTSPFNQTPGVESLTQIVLTARGLQAKKIGEKLKTELEEIAKKHLTPEMQPTIELAREHQINFDFEPPTAIPISGLIETKTRPSKKTVVHIGRSTLAQRKYSAIITQHDELKARLSEIQAQHVASKAQLEQTLAELRSDYVTKAAQLTDAINAKNQLDLDLGAANKKAADLEAELTKTKPDAARLRLLAEHATGGLALLEHNLHARLAGQTATQHGTDEGKQGEQPPVSKRFKHLEFD